MSTPVRRSVAARLSSLADAVLVEEVGWELPAAYGDADREREAIRSAVGIADVSARAKVDVRGAVAAELSAVDGIVAGISDDWAIVLGSPGAEARLLPALKAAADGGSLVTDATHLYTGIALAGPGVSGVLPRVTSWDGDRLGRGDAAAAPIADVPSVILRRDLDVPILEIYVTSDLGRYAWETLSDVVRRLGGHPVGWRALRAEGWS